MALALDLDLLPFVMVVGNLVRLGLAAPALADSADLSTHDKNCPSPLEGEVREGGGAPPRLAWRGAP
jgi:hypothetical protein